MRREDVIFRAAEVTIALVLVALVTVGIKANWIGAASDAVAHMWIDGSDTFFDGDMLATATPSPEAQAPLHADPPVPHLP